MAKKELSINVIQKAAVTLKAIGHPVRLRIIELLDKHKEMSVTSLLEKIDVEQAVLSKHLAHLKKKGILNCSVNGNFRLYSIAYPNVVHVLNCMRTHG